VDVHDFNTIRDDEMKERKIEAQKKRRKRFELANAKIWLLIKSRGWSLIRVVYPQNGGRK
jgi:hypothetical protein